MSRSQQGDQIEIDLAGGLIRNLRSGYEARLPPMAPESLKLIEDGGIANYTRRVLEQRRKRGPELMATCNVGQFSVCSAAFAWHWACPRAARAEYPEPAKRITFIVPFSAGGSNDILARAIGQKLSEHWHIPVIIENQVGASGALGAARVAKADARRLHTADPVVDLHDQCAVMPKLPFDPKTSFAPVAMLGKAPMMLAVSKRCRSKNAKELIALAREKPGALELRFGRRRQRQSHGDGAAQEPRRPRHQARALPRRQRGGERPGRRPSRHVRR